MVKEPIQNLSKRDAVTIKLFLRIRQIFYFELKKISLVLIIKLTSNTLCICFAEAAFVFIPLLH